MKHNLTYQHIDYITPTNELMNELMNEPINFN